MANETIDKNALASFVKNTLDPEIASSWDEFVKYMKDFRTHIFWGGVVISGIGLFTSLYSLGKLKNSQYQFPLVVSGIVTTILGTGIAVDMSAHLYYG